MKKDANKKIVFYDGECSLCNRTVQFILKNNHQNNIYFSSLQSEFALDFFGEYRINFSTFYFYDDFQLYTKSKAALRLSRYLSFPSNLFRLAAIVPICFRDRVYDFIAKRRKKIVNNYCAQPTLKQKERFLS